MLASIYRFLRNMSQSSSEEARDDEPDEIELRFSAARKPGRLRVLCLHGHGSNNDITQMQVGNLRLEPVHGVACDFFEGRVLAPARDTTLELFSAGPFKTWVDLDAPNESLARSLRDIMAIIKTHGPYDGKHSGKQPGQASSLRSNAHMYMRALVLSSAAAGGLAL